MNINNLALIISNSSFDEIIGSINNANEYESEELAGFYIYQAAAENTEDKEKFIGELPFHCEYLRDNGASFDEQKAIELAKVIFSTENTDLS